LIGNTLYLVAFSYYTVITFLGYNALPFLHHTELLLSPSFFYAVIWLVCLFGFNIPKHIAPVFLTGARL
jgi:UNC-50 family